MKWYLKNESWYERILDGISRLGTQRPDNFNSLTDALKKRLHKHNTTWSEWGEVNADVTAKVVRIAGRVQGDIQGTEKVIILQSGNVKGNITAPCMNLEEGGIFKGTIDMSAAEKSAETPLAAVRKTESKKKAEDEDKKQSSFAIKGG